MPRNYRIQAVVGPGMLLLVCAACATKDPPPRNFEECLARNNPAMLSEPRRCHDPDSGRTFTEQETADTQAAGAGLLD